MIAGMRRGYVDGPFGQIHYVEQGEGPAVLLLHMSGFNATQFRKALPLLADAGFRAIAIDFPGFGTSAVPPEPPSVADYARAVVALADGLGLPTVHLVGSHLGAQVATEVAVQDAARVGRVVLVGPLPTTAEEREENQAFIAIERNATVHADGGHLQNMWDLVLAAFAGWSDLESVQRLVTSQLDAAEHNWFGHNAVFSYDHAARLEQQTQPTLILTNTGDIAHGFSLRAHAAHPEFAYRELEGGTALIVDEQPEAWSAAVAEFLRG